MPDEYILLPERSLKVPRDNYQMMNFMVSVGHARSTQLPLWMSIPDVPQIKVIDSINEDGPKLVEANRETALALRKHGLRLAPVITYRAATTSRFSPNPPQGFGTGSTIHITVVSKSTPNPIPGAIVTAFTNFGANEGAEGVTGSSGNCDLDVGQTSLTLDRLYVYPPLMGFWGAYQTAVACNGTLRIELEPIQTSYPDVLTHFYGTANPSDGEHVVVGVVDTGIDNSHVDLQHVVYGTNSAKGEAATLWQDNGTGHGTHVAGIIGGRGPSRRGLAPGVELCSFRAFPKDSLETTNYQILKAVMRAMDHDCHLINLSLSSEGRPDETLRAVLQDAKDRGIVVIVAAGNEAKTQVGYPAFYAFSEGFSVSAMGRKGTFPTGSYEESDIGTKVGATDTDNFVARFSNTGDVSLIAPGVGIISTVPGGYGVMSGTSMACPGVTGMVARLLSADLAQNGSKAILKQSPDTARTIAIINLVSRAATRLFNDAKVEGDGMVL